MSEKVCGKQVEKYSSPNRCDKTGLKLWTLLKRVNVISREKKSSQHLFEWKPWNPFHCTKGSRFGHLYTATYRETRTAAVYNSKWHTDQH